jgi:GAF domain-containing protein
MNTKELENFIKGNNVNEISDWLRKGYKTLIFSPLCLANEPSVSVQIKGLFLDFDPDVQSKFKLAINQAISEWTIDNDGACVIDGLAILAAYVRSTSTIDLLRSILESEHLKAASKDEYENTTETILSVLSGFAPSEKIINIFRSLLFSEFDHQFAAQLFIGLCKCEPDRYTDFLPRFLNLTDKNPEFYDINSIILDFKEIVSEYRISKFFKDLDSKSQEKLQKLLEFSGFNFLYDTQKTLRFDSYERLQGFRKYISELKSKEEIIRAALSFIRKELSAQFAAIYLISKEGYFCRAGFDGINSKGEKINPNWYPEEKYAIGDGFIGYAGEPTGKRKFGTSQFLDYTNLPVLPPKSQGLYSEAIGSLYSGIARPLDGSNRTYGVLTVINKINVETNELLPFLRFSTNEFYQLSEICNYVMNSLFALRTAQKDKFHYELAKSLVECKPKEDKAVYKQVVQDLISPGTNFRACVLRIRDKSNSFNVVERSIVGNNFELRKDNGLDPGVGIPGNTAEKLTPTRILINENNISEFNENIDWVKFNKFTSYYCLPLFSKGKAVGTLSLYSGYSGDNFKYIYDYSSSKEFLASISTLLATFIQNADQDKVFDKAIRCIDHVVNDELEPIRKSLAQISIKSEVMRDIKHRLHSAQSTLGSTNKSMRSCIAENNELGRRVGGSIYVGNLSYAVTQEELVSTFAEYGSVKSVQLPTDRETGRLRGFAFVEMGSDADPEKAIAELNGSEWMGRSLRVNKAKPREDNRGGSSRQRKAG